MTKRNTWLLAAATLCFILIAVANAIAFLNPSAGYEISLYESTPQSVWILLMAAAAVAIILIVHEAVTAQYAKRPFFVIPLLMLVLVRVSLLYIPFIRGYYAFGGDHASHIGTIRDILLFGAFSDRNVYPALHMFAGSLSLVTGLPVEFISNHANGVISVFYVIALFLLAKEVFPEGGVKMFVLAAIGAVFNSNYHVYLMPNGWAFLFLPFVLYVFFRAQKSGDFKALFLVILALYPFLHPLGSVVLLLLLLFIGLARIVFHYTTHRSINLPAISHNLMAREFLFLFVIFLPWLLTFQQFYANIQGFFLSIFTAGETLDRIGLLAARAEQANVGGLELMGLVMRTIGHNIIYLALTIIGAVILIALFRRHGQKYFSAMLLLGMVASFGLVYALYLFNVMPSLESIDASRILPLTLMLTPLFVGFTLYHGVKRWGRAMVPVVVAILLVTMIFSTYSLHESPMILRPNPQMTESNIGTAGWLAEYKDTGIFIAEIISPIYRYADAGVGTTLSRNTFRRRYAETPDHFNYTVSARLGESFERGNYLVIPKFDKELYTKVWSVVDRYNDADFQQLGRDISVDKLYMNGEDGIWLIHGTRG
jgi:hypothetical protein